MKQGWTIAIVLSTGVTLLSAVTASRGTTIAFPEGYRSWTHVKTTLIGPQHPNFSSNGGYHHFYANDKAMVGYRTGRFPDGSILIDDGLEAAEKDGVSTEGARRRVAVMVKDSTRFAKTGDWGFESFPGDTRLGSLTPNAKAACLACHKNAPRDLVFSSFRR